MIKKQCKKCRKIFYHYPCKNRIYCSLKCSNGRLFIKIDVKKATYLYNKGFSLKEIAKKLKTTLSPVRSRLLESGLSLHQPKGENSNCWKGNNASYYAFHIRINKERGRPKNCEFCKRTDKKRYEWASISKNYHNVYDYIRLCTSCHRKFDNNKNL